jgi:hypothetical protein
MAGSGPAVRGCVRGLVRGENLAGRGRFRGWSSRTGAPVPRGTGGSSAPPPGPGFRQGL